MSLISHFNSYFSPNGSVHDSYNQCNINTCHTLIVNHPSTTVILDKICHFTVIDIPRIIIRKNLSLCKVRKKFRFAVAESDLVSSEGKIVALRDIRDGSSKHTRGYPLIASVIDILNAASLHACQHHCTHASITARMPVSLHACQHHCTHVSTTTPYQHARSVQSQLPVSCDAP